MKLVVIKETKEYDVIRDSDFDSAIYSEVTESIGMWDKYGNGKVDYMAIRSKIMDLVAQNGFNDTKEKEIVAKYCATDANSLVGYFMAQGQSQEDAIMKYKMNRAEDIRMASESAEARITSTAFTFSIIKYLSEEDGQTFLDAIRNFSIDFRNAAVTGTNYGNAVDGIMDYIESTGSYVNGGLKNYSINSPYTLSEFITDLKKIIVYGEY